MGGTLTKSALRVKDSAAMRTIQSQKMVSVLRNSSGGVNVTTLACGVVSAIDRFTTGTFGVLGPGSELAAKACTRSTCVRMPCDSTYVLR